MTLRQARYLETRLCWGDLNTLGRADVMLYGVLTVRNFLNDLYDINHLTELPSFVFEHHEYLKKKDVETREEKEDNKGVVQKEGRYRNDIGSIWYWIDMELVN